MRPSYEQIGILARLAYKSSYKILGNSQGGAVALPQTFHRVLRAPDERLEIFGVEVGVQVHTVLVKCTKVRR